MFQHVHSHCCILSDVFAWVVGYTKATAMLVA